MAYRVVHYLNQFYAGVGGEEKADLPPALAAEGPVGPGVQLQQLLGSEAQIVATVYCGDGYFAENLDRARREVLELIKKYSPDAVVTGPAFNAGRYGTAAGAVGQAVAKELGVPVVSGMYVENPGVELYRKDIYIVSTADSARGMREALQGMASLLLKLLKGQKLGSPAEEGYIERGIRVNCFRDEIGAKRAVDMLLKKLKGEPFATEYPMPEFDRVPPMPPVKDLSKAKIALVTSGGIVPKGNPDRIEASSATKYGEYSIAGLEDLTSETHQTAHGGYDPTYANADPDRVLPVDVMRQLEREGVFGKLHDLYYATVGNGTPVANAKRFGKEIAEKLKQANVDAVILTST